MADDFDRPDDLKLAQEAALAGAAEGLRHFAALAGLPRELKKDGTVVTAADRAVEDRIREVLTGARPGDAILGEEHGETSGEAGRRWIIDPIDGTHLFVEGDNRWLVLIALEDRGEITVGVAAVPAQGRIWWAIRGGGAWEAQMLDGRILDEQRIHVAPGPTPALAETRLGVVPHWGREPFAALIDATDERPWPVQPSLMVARGDLDLALQTGGQIWDFAATSLIVTEAGGSYRGLDGRTRPGPGASLYSRNAELAGVALKAVTNP
ncbi:inositol monophosphatase family protein [Actinoplanes sp. NEAU-A12]|uniref:Inositol monophosphatase family protein n=1 Tax=Actinoplanes sandaracinus TaxID=3045177 RepID=A0ABT6WK51_9ACTN|nr:inositol monophosphatase family protein [Actinoplanes sandaracinus]MDI6100107.1 inositol monophosphatase family protein [Actinoplanes sandaracinus]